MKGTEARFELGQALGKLIDASALMEQAESLDRSELKDLCATLRSTHALINAATVYVESLLRRSGPRQPSPPEPAA